MRSLGIRGSVFAAFFLGIIAVSDCFAASCVGHGDQVLNLGTNGYASIRDSEFRGFNSQGDFSLEVMLNIEANAAGGRWPVLLGKKNSPPEVDRGYALTIDQGHFPTVGQQINASLSDGTNAAGISSRLYQGVVHAVMTWNATAKVLQLYVNGGLERSRSNVVVDPAKLVNTQDFMLGGPSRVGKALQRDIFVARIWNRALDGPEVTAIWNALDSAGKHALPIGFDRNGLVSEWLMDSVSDAKGVPGLTHLRDSQGLNHLELKSGAECWLGSGELRLVEPRDGAVGVSKSVFLKAAGGMGSLAPGLSGPLEYEFQVDESTSFTSTALKSSGWLRHYGQWKPVLKPSTHYFWRVRVRDTAGSSVSSFTPSWSFITQAATKWYVRPWVYSINNGSITTTPGAYGTQDGTSYQNAWNGLNSVLWGERGVEAGDTLYVCGTHLYTLRDYNFLAHQGLLFIPESGYSDEHPIMLRMDALEERGLMWAVCYNLINGGGTWQGPDANGVYRSSDYRYGASYWGDGASLSILPRAPGITWTEATPGAIEIDGVTYVKTPDGKSPAGKLYSSVTGYRLHLGRSSYIRFQNCSFYAGAPTMDMANWNSNEDTRSRLPLSSHITFDGCRLRFNSLISPTPGHDHWTVSNSEISDAGYGVYTFSNKRTSGANCLTVRSNYFHDLGMPPFGHKDAHAIGVQGGDGHIIEHNRIENTGEAICFWSGIAPMRNHVIRYNFIKNIHVMNVTGGGGISISGDNSTAQEGMRSGFKVYGNIIVNTGIGGTDDWHGNGIRSNCKDFIDVFNNTIYSARSGIVLSVMGATAKGRVVNNIIMNPRDFYIKFAGEDGVSSDSVVDYNLFYPDTNIAAKFGLYSFQHDLHSVLSDPRFVSATPSDDRDFRLLPDSKAIRAGVRFGMTRDYVGNPIPPEVAPDIGALQYFSSGSPPAPPPNLRLVPPGN